VEASSLFKSIGLSVKVMRGRTVNRERECALAAQCIGKLPGLRLWSYGAEGAVACSAVVSRGVIEGPFFFGVCGTMLRLPYSSHLRYTARRRAHCSSCWVIVH